MKKENLKLENEKLKNRIRILEASQPFKLVTAIKNIEKCGVDRYTGSAVTLTIKNINLSNTTLVEEVAIADGLSIETINAIKADLKRAHDLSVNHPVNKL